MIQIGNLALLKQLQALHVRQASPTARLSACDVHAIQAEAPLFPGACPPHKEVTAMTALLVVGGFRTVDQDDCVALPMRSGVVVKAHYSSTPRYPQIAK